MNEENNMNLSVDENDTLNNWSTEYNSGNNGKKSNKKGIVLLITIIIGIAILGGLFYYFKIYTRADQFYKRLIGIVVDDCEEQLLNSDYKTLDAEISLDANVNLNTSVLGTEIENIINLINEIDIKLGAKYDNENQKVIVDLDSDYQKEELLNLQVYSDLKSEKAYIHLGSLLDKYIELDEESMSYDSEISVKDVELTLGQEWNIKEFTKELKKEILESIKMEYCSSEKEEIEINNEKTTVTKNTFKIKYTQLVNEMTQILQRVKNNEKMLDCLTEQGKTDFLNAIDAMLEGVEDLEYSYYDNLILEYNIYTKGIFMTEVVKFETKIATESYEMVLLTTEKKSDNEWSYNIPLDGSAKIYGTINSNGEEGNKLNLNVEMEGVGLLTLDLGYNLKYNVTIDNIDVSNASTMEELTEQEQTTLMTNLQNSKIYELILPFVLDNNNDDSNYFDHNNSNVISSDGTVTIYTYENENSVKVKVPTGYKLDSYSDEETIWLVKNDDTEMMISTSYSDVQEYYEELEWDEEYYKKSENYTAVKLSDMQSIVVNNRTFYIATLDYTYVDSLGEEYNIEYSEKFIWTQISNDYVAEIELEGWENITSEELNTVLSSLEIK